MSTYTASHQIVDNESRRGMPASSEVQHITQKLRDNWQYYVNKGHLFHKQGGISQAIDCFMRCIDIGKRLLHLPAQRHYALKPSNNKTTYSHCELLYIASHNLAACHNAQHNATRGEYWLKRLHQEMVAVCRNPRCCLEIRLEALSILDKSLFSLASQLAYTCKINELHTLIRETEKHVSEMSALLNTGVIQYNSGFNPNE